MFKCVVISKDQSKYIPYFEKSLKNIEHIYVIDRPTEEYPKNIPTLYNYEGTGFLAGKMRDLGANYFNYDSDILFLDGDKYPIKGNLEKLDKIEGDIIMLPILNDKRIIFNNLQENNTKEYIIKDKTNPQNFVYSCGILLRKRFIDYVRKINNDGRIFKEIFDGNFGEEDRFLGDIVSCTENFKIVITNTIILNGEFNGLKDREDSFLINFNKRLKLKFGLFYGK